MVQTTYQAPRIRTALPGPKAREVLARDERCVSPSYTRDYPLVAARGHGCWVEDVDGNCFLDLAAGIAVCSTGHCHPRVVEAVKSQADTLLHISGTDFYEPNQALLAERLSTRVPKGPWRSFFGNSGAEAVECALKLSRWHSKRQLLISFEGAFHGRTMGALSLTASKPVHKDGFFPLVPGVHHVPYGDSEAVERLLEGPVPPEELAAIFVEPIQGEGGYRVAPVGFLQELREICNRTGAMLVLDEVQAGMGRTGRLFGYEHDGIDPDVICTAKGIASGLPLGVCLAKDKLMDWPAGSHASTFGGNPLACRAALTTLELLDEGLIENAGRVGAFLHQRLADHCLEHKAVVEIRGRGLMLAVEVTTPKLRDQVVRACFERGVLVLGCGKKAIRFSPPLVLDEDEAEVGATIFAEALRASA